MSSILPAEAGLSGSDVQQRGMSIRTIKNYDYAPVKRGMLIGADYNKLYRIGMRKSADDGEYYFQPGTHLQNVRGYIDTSNYVVSRSPSPERDAEYFNASDDARYFLIPLEQAEAAAAHGAEKIHVPKSALPAKDTISDKILFVFKFADHTRGLNWFRHYPVVDVSSGLVRYGINSENPDMHQTSQRLHGQLPAHSANDRNSGRDGQSIAHGLGSNPQSRPSEHFGR